MNASIEDGLIAANPAAKLARGLKLTRSKATEQEEINALTEGPAIVLGDSLRRSPALLSAPIRPGVSLKRTNPGAGHGFFFGPQNSPCPNLKWGTTDLAYQSVSCPISFLIVARHQTASAL